MEKYNVIKRFHGDSMRTNLAVKNNLYGVSFQKAQEELVLNESLWNKHGGLVIDKTETSLTVQESDDSATITWSIEEVEEWEAA